MMGVIVMVVTAAAAAQTTPISCTFRCVEVERWRGNLTETSVPFFFLFLSFFANSHFIQLLHVRFLVSCLSFFASFTSSYFLFSFRVSFLSSSKYSTFRGKVSSCFRSFLVPLLFLFFFPLVGLPR